MRSYGGKIAQLLIASLKSCRVVFRRGFGNLTRGNVTIDFKHGDGMSVLVALQSPTALNHDRLFLPGVMDEFSLPFPLVQDD